MKKLLLVSVLFLLLSVVTPVYAGDVDGLWALIPPDLSLGSFVMLRENSDVLLMTNLELGLDDWQAFFGPFDNTTAHLTTLVSRWEQLGITCNFLSPNSASCAIISCASTASTQCDNDTIGTTFTLQKLF
jgi:hypothetical protein